MSRHNYAEALDASDPQEAIRLHRQTLAGKIDQLGAKNISTGITLNSLGVLLRKQGELAEAEELLLRALEIREAHPAEKRDAAITRDELGVLLQSAGRHEEARAMRLRKGKANLLCSLAMCSKLGSEPGVHLQACSRCRAIWYCCKVHQTADWKGGHKRVCKQLQVAA